MGHVGVQTDASAADFQIFTSYNEHFLFEFLHLMAYDI